MMKMTREEREAWREARGKPWRQPAEFKPAGSTTTPEARMRYIRFATEAAAFCRARKPVRFTGDHWKL